MYGLARCCMCSSPFFTSTTCAVMQQVYCSLLAVILCVQLMLTKAKAGPLQDADLPAGVLLSTVVGSPVAR